MIKISFQKVKPYLHLCKRKERTRLTFLGWLIMLSILTLFSTFIAKRAHSFLATTEPVDAQILVVEGHIPDYAIDSAKALIEKHHYTHIFTTGIPFFQGADLCGYKNYADLTAASLISRGVDPKLVVSVPCSPKQRDRTYESALALKRRLKLLNLNGGKINVFTTDTHARRTRIMFQEGLGDSWDVGVISITSIDYDTKKWWTSSYGMRAVIYEGLAWIYAAFIFNPKPQ